MKKVVLKKWHSLYVLRENQFSDYNNYLLMVKDVLCDHGGSIDWIKRRLLDPKSRGITGNSTVTKFRENKVSIEPLYGDDSESYRIEIDRDVLLKIVLDWEELTKQEPDEIIITQDEQGVITLTGTFDQKKTSN